MANAYKSLGKLELWQPTLESYLKLEDLSLSHAQVHQMIAVENNANRHWKSAQPHALEAAQTYSAWGLALASRTFEGLQQWEKSEFFASEASRNYPSYSSGSDWYFWCRRTGRGDRAAAQKIAEQSIQIAAQQTYLTSAQRAFVYRLMEGQGATAIGGADRAVRALQERGGGIHVA